MSKKNKPNNKNTLSCKVNQLIGKGNDEILLGIFNPYFNLQEYLNATAMSENLVKSFVELLAKALSCNALRMQTFELVMLIAASKFLNHLVYAAIQRKTAANEYDINMLDSVVKIMKIIFELSPDAFTQLKRLNDRLELIIVSCVNHPSLIRDYEEFKKRTKATTSKASRQRFEALPPENFTQLNVVPKMSDLISEKDPFLRENIVDGAYTSLGHYLDVQFRLMREDFLRPLREGVTKVKRIMSGLSLPKDLSTLPNDLKIKMNSIDSAKVYLSANVVGYEYTNDGVAYAIKINGLKIKDVTKSKQFMMGSLLCFSSDAFQTSCMVGLVSERNIGMLKTGIVVVRFEFETRPGFGIDRPNLNDSYMMIETTAFFEPYRHVLDALIEFDRLGEKDFPFKDQIVYCRNAMYEPPKYLINKHINFTSLLDQERSFHSEGNEYSISSSSMKSWPTAQQVGLNDSQYKALKLALTNKLTIIQGPPGTGKTHVGVKIVNLLLQNKNLWLNADAGVLTANSDNVRQKPILMICFTNHALDQFLEHCIQKCGITEGAIRVGGQSKNENLSKFLLKNIKRQKSQKLGKDIWHRIKEERQILENLRERFDISKSCINQCKRGLLSANSLNELKSGENDKAFDTVFFKSDIMLLEWLELLKITSATASKEAPNKLADLLFNNLYVSEKSGTNSFNCENDYTTEDEDYFEKETRERKLDNDDDDEDVATISKGFRSSRNQFVQQSDREILDINYILKIISDFRSENDWQIKTSRKNKPTENEKMFITELLFAFNSNFSQNQYLSLNINPRKRNDVWDFSKDERIQIYQYLCRKFIAKHQNKITPLEASLNKCSKRLKELRMQHDREILQRGKIIAMTTTGAARYHRILKDIGPRIVIVEEAAEVFESHIVSALSKDCEHLILIGDHFQLRPNPNVYDLAQKYRIDVSLFERLVSNKAKMVMLTCQHRMRPEIRKLMSSFYKDAITDDSSVHKHPNVKGLKKNVYFINHIQPEKSSGENKSKSNVFEAEYIAKLAEYLCMRGNDSSKITILSMYSGQLVEIREKLKQLNLNEVKVSTVDDYQGEENDIIILSLVRSNERNEAGFLKIDNRICVALTRARHGLYCIGNFQMLRKVSEKWAHIIALAQANGSLGGGLELTCGSHPQNDAVATDPGHFDSRVCKLPCNFKLKCGHKCKLTCHSSDHEDLECQSPCMKFIKVCGHFCQKPCGHSGSCQKDCSTIVEKLHPKCDHMFETKCSNEPKVDEPCIAKISVDSVCKHPGKLEVRCANKPYQYKISCTKPCKELLNCGHECQATCGECFGGLIHSDCQKICDKLLVCGHKCRLKCSEICAPSREVCTIRCILNFNALQKIKYDRKSSLIEQELKTIMREIIDVTDIKDGFEDIYNELQLISGKITDSALVSLKSKVELTKRICDIQKMTNDKITIDQKNLIEFELNKLKSAMLSKSKAIILSEQRTIDLDLELKRISKLIDYFRLSNRFEKNTFYYSKSQEYISTYNSNLKKVLLSKIERFDDEKQKEVDKLIKIFQTSLRVVEINYPIEFGTSS